MRAIVAVVALGLVACHGDAVGDFSDAGADVATDALTDLSVDTLDASDSLSNDGDATDSKAEISPADAGAGGLVVGTFGTRTNQTGNAQQHHLVWANDGARWWYFHLDAADGTTLVGSWSQDFATWTPVGSTLSFFPGPVHDARDFDVAHAILASHDVLHVGYVLFVPDTGVGKSFGYHARATISGDTFAWETPAEFASTSELPGFCHPDGTSAAIAGDGHTYFATGCFNENGVVPGKTSDTVGNMDAWRSSGVDDGTTGAAAATTDAFHAWITYQLRARALVPVKTADLLAVWSSTDVASDYDQTLDFQWASTDGAWSVHTSLASDAPTMQNDWSVCAPSTSTVHLVRREIDGGRNDRFQDMIYDATAKTWSAGSPIPDDPGVAGTGVVLLTDGNRLLLFHIAADGKSSVRRTELTPGIGWSAWTTAFGAPATRTFLSGSGCETKDHSAIVWTEGAAAPYSVVGADVTGTF